ncbi:hypothetical protein B0H19DRAFT_1170398 [Mycena capillaripes]|nr:hypothetical protein B0H19DRAFT_1170398 [Mycena capillaripes]
MSELFARQTSLKGQLIPPLPKLPPRTKSPPEPHLRNCPQLQNLTPRAHLLQLQTRRKIPPPQSLPKVHPSLLPFRLRKNLPALPLFPMKETPSRRGPPTPPESLHRSYGPCLQRIRGQSS